MASSSKLLYIVVADHGRDNTFRYTRPVLQSTLQLMGCKPRHAFKVLLLLFIPFLQWNIICSF